MQHILFLSISILSYGVIFVDGRKYKRPQLSITIRDGVYNDVIEGLDPVLTWEDTSDSGGGGMNPLVVSDGAISNHYNRNNKIDVTGGINAGLRRLPDRLWGRIRTQIGNQADASIRADYNGRNRDTTLNFNLEDVRRRYDFRCDTQFGWRSSPILQRIEGTKRFFMRDYAGNNAGGAGGNENAYQFSITPRVLQNPNLNRSPGSLVGDAAINNGNRRSRNPNRSRRPSIDGGKMSNMNNLYYRDLVLEYGTVQRNQNGGSTNIRMTLGPRGLVEKLLEINHSTIHTAIRIMASSFTQEVTASQQLDEDNNISVKMNNLGDLALSWEHIFGRTRRKFIGDGGNTIMGGGGYSNTNFGGMLSSKNNNNNSGGGILGGRRSGNKNYFVVVKNEEEQESSLKATLQTRSDTILLEYKDGPWTANVDMPLYFFDRGGITGERSTTFRINRRIELTTP